MNCELAHERIVLATYGELSDEHVHELDRHLVGCNECREEREQLLALRTLAAVLPVVEPDANLVARSRMRLEEALDALPARKWYERLAQRMMNNFASMQAAPVAAALLLIVGAGAGLIGGYEVAQSKSAHQASANPTLTADSSTAPTAAPQSQAVSLIPSQVASVSNVTRQPGSDLVEVSYNQVIPHKVQGSLSDPSIRQLLMMASENAASPGVRDNSVGLLAAECRAGNGCDGTGVRDALMVALRYDRNEAVREKALRGLEPYVAQDMRVRDAVLEALLNDSDARIRSQAISILEPVEADTSVRQVLYSVSNTDQSPQIRNVSRQVLSRVPEIQ
ncbi:MAG: zf-HC2 domain-containing protein [Acidobacteriota bacterium]|nr:zf-HC2 domain-containing protein [Acidobacteriota bacterium]